MKAIQLDGSFAYAHTLSGHEHMAMEDLEKAAVCFRNAIQLDDRVRDIFLTPTSH